MNQCILLVIIFLSLGHSIHGAAAAEENESVIAKSAAKVNRADEGPQGEAVENVKAILQLVSKDKNELNRLIFAATHKREPQALKNLFRRVVRKEEMHRSASLLMLVPFAPLVVPVISRLLAAYRKSSSLERRGVIALVATVGALTYAYQRSKKAEAAMQFCQSGGARESAAQCFESLTSAPAFYKFALAIDNFFDANELIRKMYRLPFINSETRTDKPWRQSVEWILDHVNSQHSQEKSKAQQALICMLSRSLGNDPLQLKQSCFSRIRPSSQGVDFSLDNYFDWKYQFQLFNWFLNVDRDVNGYNQMLNNLSAIKSDEIVEFPDGAYIGDFQFKRDIVDLCAIFHENARFLGDQSLDSIFEGFRIVSDFSRYNLNGSAGGMKVKVLRKDNTCIGFIDYFIGEDGKGVVAEAGIRKAFQGKGYSGSLLLYALKDMFQHVETVVWDTLTINKVVQKLSEGFGIEIKETLVWTPTVTIYHYEMNRQQFEAALKKYEAKKQAESERKDE